MHFGLLIIGDEILSGRRSDKHLAKAIELLGARGLQVAYADYVGDAPARITTAIERALASGDTVFSFGGIGATPDDHTRQCAARALGVPLQLHPRAKELILERMQDVAREQGLPYEPERADNLHRLNMGMFPAGCDIIPNPYNKIPGFSCGHVRNSPPGRPKGNSPPEGAATREAAERGGIYFFPGFPVMAWPMVEWVLDTRYAHLFHATPHEERSVIVFGAIEATLTPLMELLEREHAVKVFSLPSVDHPEYGKHIELGVKGAPAAVAGAFAQMLAQLRGLDIPLGPEAVR